MQASRKHAVLGRYALYFLNASETLRDRRRRFFGRDAHSEVLQSGLNDSSGKDQGVSHSSHSKAGSGTKEKKERSVEQLEEAVEKGKNILLEATAVFPFDTFPDSITIDRQKLTVVHRRFFSSKQKVSVQLSDIKNVQADLGPIFGSLTFTSEHFINNTQTIRYLPRKDVLAIQQMVQGFIVAHQEGIDLGDIDDEELKKKLDELGRGEPSEQPVIQ